MSLSMEMKKGDPKTLVISWDGEVWRCVYKPLFISGLKKISVNLSWEEFLAQFAEIEKKAAKRYAIWLLSRRIYLSSDLTVKLLSKGFSSNVSEEILLFCQGHGYLNDSQEMTRLIAKEQKKGVATRAIYYKLKTKKGVDEALIRQLLQKNAASDQVGLRQWLEKNKRQINCNDRLARNKLIAKLCRRGFSLELVMNELKRDEWKMGCWDDI